MPREFQTPAAPQKTPGFQENFQLAVFDGFKTLNTKPTRPAIEDQEMFWCDNWMPLGRNNLRTMYDLDPFPFTIVGMGSAGAPAPAIYITGQSCELFRFPLTASGMTVPPVDITGTTSTLTGPLGNLKSNTLAVDVDTATGNQYVLTQSQTSSSGGWNNTIPVFAPNATGNIAPIINIQPTNSQFIQGTEVNFGALCLDASKNIYTGFTVGANTLNIWKIAAGSNGAVAATSLVSDSTVTLTSLCYDSINNLIWASVYTNAGFHSQARSYTTAGVLQTTITTTRQILAGEVFIGPAGQIVLCGDGSSAQSVVQVFPTGSSGAAVASQTIVINPAGAQGPVVPCGAMDSNGVLYVGPITDISGNAVIFVYSSGTSGTDPATIRTFTSPLFINMADGTATDITNIVIR